MPPPSLPPSAPLAVAVVVVVVVVVVVGHDLIFRRCRFFVL